MRRARSWPPPVAEARRLGPRADFEGSVLAAVLRETATKTGSDASPCSSLSVTLRPSLGARRQLLKGDCPDVIQAGGASPEGAPVFPAGGRGSELRSPGLRGEGPVCGCRWDVTPLRVTPPPGHREVCSAAAEAVMPRGPVPRDAELPWESAAVVSPMCPVHLGVALPWHLLLHGSPPGPAAILTAGSAPRAPSAGPRPSRPHSTILGWEM